MYQKMYDFARCRCLILLALVPVLLVACAIGPKHCHGSGCAAGHGSHAHDHDHDHQHAYTEQRIESDGLIVGAVVNANGGSELKPYQRWRYADQLASRILSINPQLTGSVDSYQYLSRRMGKPVGALLQGYRQQGELQSDEIKLLQDAQLRRRYVLLASILPVEETIALDANAEPVVGPINREVHDYYDTNRHTALLKAVRVNIYDTASGRKVFDQIIRSDDGGQILATENKSRKYVGNSLVASISNTIANGLGGTVSGAYPAPPKSDDVLAHIWQRVAQQLPGAIF